MDTVFLPWPVVLPSPSVAAFTELKTVVSTSVLEFEPAPGTTPPWMPRAVVFPPASPVCEAVSWEEKMEIGNGEWEKVGEKTYDNGDFAVG